MTQEDKALWIWYLAEQGYTDTGIAAHTGYTRHFVSGELARREQALEAAKRQRRVVLVPRRPMRECANCGG